MPKLEYIQHKNDMPSSGKSPLELLAQTCNSIGKEVKPKAIPQAAEHKINGKSQNNQVPGKTKAEMETDSDTKAKNNVKTGVSKPISKSIAKQISQNSLKPERMDIEISSSPSLKVQPNEKSTKLEKINQTLLSSKMNNLSSSSTLPMAKITPQPIIQTGSNSPTVPISAHHSRIVNSLQLRNGKR